MGRAKKGTQTWLANNKGDMIQCPYQPGQLMISKKACSKRYKLSRKESTPTPLKGDLFHFSFQRGLSLCRTCPIGKKMARTHSVAS